MTFSLSIDHTPWIQARRENLARMLLDLLPLSSRVPYFNHDTKYEGKWVDVKHEWAIAKWRWHIGQDVTHCIMLSDDLAIAPHFWDIVSGMVDAAPHDAIGLMSNHPKGPSLLADGTHWYRCNSWLVGPGIIMPRNMLVQFVAWYESWYFTLPTGRDVQGYRDWYHDDSSVNEWLTRVGRWSLHPLPAPIEHQLSLGRSHDAAPFPKYAAESISWKREWHDNPRTFSELPRDVAEGMRAPEWWAKAGDAPMLEVV
jgi:hypothetical protein